jgi:hypothetical protein
MKCFSKENNTSILTTCTYFWVTLVETFVVGVIAVGPSGTRL